MYSSDSKRACPAVPEASVQDSNCQYTDCTCQYWVLTLGARQYLSVCCTYSGCPAVLGSLPAGSVTPGQYMRLYLSVCCTHSGCPAVLVSTLYLLWVPGSAGKSSCWIWNSGVGSCTGLLTIPTAIQRTRVRTTTVQKSPLQGRHSAIQTTHVKSSGH